MKIAIFGGSFNPIHKGHTQIAEFAIEHLGLDKLIFVPTAKNPLKIKEKNISGDDRANMINLVLPEKAEVSDFEIKRGGTSYTIDTIKYFKQKYPGAKLYILVGTDLIGKLNKWKNIDSICELATFAVFKRSRDFSKINIKKYNAILMDNKIHNYSSTAFKKLEFDNVDTKVMEYIGSNFLYVPEILFSMMNGDKKRHMHSIATGEAAAIYAKLLNLNSKKAWFAGIFHDITKAKPKEWHREFLESYGHKDVKEHQLHSLSAYYWIRDIYMCKDEEIINAVKKHTTLAMQLSDMDKVIYAADKLCSGRAWEGIQEHRKFILEDFESGFSKLVKTIFLRETIKRGNLGDEQNRIYERHI